MPLEAHYHNDNTLYRSITWFITDQTKLAEYVALILIAKYDHVQKIIEHSHSEQTGIKVSVVESVLKSILKHPKKKQQRYQRDGLLFQHISWIAAAMQKNKGDFLGRPHNRLADKGQDLLIIHSSTVRNDIEGVTICEDKATENCRTTIRKVYNDFKTYENGEREAELESEVLTILKENFSGEEANKIIEKIFWERVKRYRINITVPDNSHDDNLFKDYDVIVTGDISRRIGETTIIENLRPWFDKFAAQVIENLERMMLK